MPVQLGQPLAIRWWNHDRLLENGVARGRRAPVRKPVTSSRAVPRHLGLWDRLRTSRFDRCEAALSRRPLRASNQAPLLVWPGHCSVPAAVAPDR